jgi:hypothetical protein
MLPYPIFAENLLKSDVEIIWDATRIIGVEANDSQIILDIRITCVKNMANVFLFFVF